MADETPDQAGKCVACDIGFYLLVGLGVALVAFMAADVFTSGKATEAATALFRRVQPSLAVVRPLRQEGGASGDADAG